MSEPIVTFDEDAIKDELKDLVRSTVESTLNALLDEEADDLVGAERYERTADRDAYRAGHYERGLTTTSGQVTIKMYLAGVSTRYIEDVFEILWGSSVSAATVSNLNDKAFEAIEK